MSERTIFLVVPGQESVALLGLAAPLARRAGKTGPAALEQFEDERLVRLDNASQRLGLVQRGRAEKPVSPAEGRGGVDVATFGGPRHAGSLDHRLGVVEPFSFLRSPAIGVFVRALNVRPQLLQRERARPFARPQRRCRAPRNGGNPGVPPSPGRCPPARPREPGAACARPPRQAPPVRPPILEPPPQPVCQSPTQRPHRPCKAPSPPVAAALGSTYRSRPANPQIPGSPPTPPSDAPRLARNQY